LFFGQGSPLFSNTLSRAEPCPGFFWESYALPRWALAPRPPRAELFRGKYGLKNGPTP